MGGIWAGKNVNRCYSVERGALPVAPPGVISVARGVFGGPGVPGWRYPGTPGRTTWPGRFSVSTSPSFTIGTPFTIVQATPFGRAE